MDVRQLTDQTSISSYTRDESASFDGSAEAVYLPRAPEEVAAVLQEAAVARRPVTLSGAGTSITGSRVPHGGIVVSTERLRDARAVPLPGPAGAVAARGSAGARGREGQPESGPGAGPAAGKGPAGAGAQPAGATRAAGDWEPRGGPEYTVLFSDDGCRAIVPAGIRLFELDQALAGDGVFYPPDPTETTAMLGGTIATNASGARSYRYGATRNWVEALLVVPVGGDPVWVRRGEWVARNGNLPLPPGFPASHAAVPDTIQMPATKHAAGLYLERGLDLVDLLIGSEGTLAAIAAAEVRLAPRPAAIFQYAGFFASEADALDFAAKLRGRSRPGRTSGPRWESGSSVPHGGLVPDGDPQHRTGPDIPRAPASILSIEYMDGASLDFIRAQYPETPGAQGCVLVEEEYEPVSEHNPYPPEERLLEIQETLRSAGATADWVAAGEELRGMKSFRHALPEQVNRWVGERVGKLGTDMAVPPESFPAIWKAYAQARSAGIRTVLFGHLGQYHLHLNFLPADEMELARSREHYLHLARTAVALGGTISAEHGVGKKHLVDEDGADHPYLYYLYGNDGLRAIQRVKAAFDPAGLLNRDTMIPSE